MAEEKLIGAELMLRVLTDQGVDLMFGYPGGVTLPVYDALAKQNSIRHILVRHEQGGVHAAEGYARSTGRPGVVFATSGPGATNTVTGLLDALMDSIPLVCITGQVFSHLIGNDAFQEADTTGITRPCTKHNFLVTSPDQVAPVLHEAFYIATHGRPGPVLVDITKDALIGEGAYSAPIKEHRTYRPQLKGDKAAIEEAVELLSKAKKPMVYIGGGVINAGPKASKLVTQFVKMTGFPCTTTLMALGAYPGHDEQFLGMPGMHGTYEANMAMYECDVMFNIGARFDDRVTGDVTKFSPGSTKIHVDIDPSSINKTIMADLPIIGDAGTVMDQVIKAWRAKHPRVDQKALKAWWAEIDGWRARRSIDYDQGADAIVPQYPLTRLNEILKGKDYYITTDVGQHQMWAAQHLLFDKPNRWMTSGGLGTMGYGLPSAMGVQFAHPDSIVVCVTSEGSLMMNIQELATIVQHGLPVKILNLNNSVLGMIHQWQALFHGARYSQCDLDGSPDFVKLADAFGAKGLYCDKPADVDACLKEMIETPGPVLANVVVEKMENVYPMIPAGAAHNEIILGDEGSEQAKSGKNQVLVS